MSNLYFDMETIPDQRPDAMAECIANVSAPARYKKPESIDKWMEENAEEAGAEAYQKLGLNGISGEICSLSWAVDDADVRGHIRLPGESEEELIDAFFADVRSELDHDHTRLCWVGHNIIDFDLRFLKQRCIVNGIHPPILLPADARHGTVVFDTMKAWGGWKGFVSQDALCKALGIAGKSVMHGSEVCGAYQNGRHEEILEYNKDDVRIVREIYRRMSWA